MVEIVVDVEGQRADLALVDGLARIRLEARRQGWTIQLSGSSSDVRDLLALVGLDDLLVEVDGEPEEPEQLGIDEAGDLGDLPA